MSAQATFKLLAAGRTDVGRRRQHNEDSFACDLEHSLFVVADGMGGHAAGEIASARAVEAVRQMISSFDETADFTWPFGLQRELSVKENLLINAIKLANRTVCSLALEHPEYSGMGTTVVGLFLDGRDAIIAHVGDSRAYLLRDNQLRLLTEDHSWVNEQVQQHLLTEEEAKTHRWRNIITRALGNRFDVDVDHQRVELQVGDALLLCTDGLSGPVTESELARILQEGSDRVEETCMRLIDEANQRGGPDNITVVVVRVVETQ